MEWILKNAREESELSSICDLRPSAGPRIPPALAKANHSVLQGVLSIWGTGSEREESRDGTPKELWFWFLKPRETPLSTNTITTHTPTLPTVGHPQRDALDRPRGANHK